MMMYVWLAAMAVFLIIEAACPIHLVSIWFAAGSLLAMIVTMLGGGLWLQITVFLAVSCGLLAALWPFVKKVLKPRVTATNVDGILHTQGVVLEEIDNLNALGQVKLGGIQWSARSTTGEHIRAGTRVTVDRIEGNKVFVSEAAENAVIQ